MGVRQTRQPQAAFKAGDPEGAQFETPNINRLAADGINRAN
jgi:hypothetical protein